MARAVLADGGFDVAGEIANAESALEAALRPGPDCLFVDAHLGDADGFAVADESAARHGPVVVLTWPRPARSRAGHPAERGARVHRQGPPVGVRSGEFLK